MKPFALVNPAFGTGIGVESKNARLALRDGR